MLHTQGGWEAYVPREVWEAYVPREVWEAIHHLGYIGGYTPLGIPTLYTPGYTTPVLHHAAVLTVWPVTGKRGPGLRRENNRENEA